MRKFVQGSYLAVSAVFLWGLFLLFNSSNISDWTLTLRLSLARSECRVPCSVSVLLIVDFTAFPPALFTAPWVVVSTETGLLELELSWRTSQVWTSSMFLGGRIFFSSTSYMILGTYRAVKQQSHASWGTSTDKWVISIAAIPYCRMVFILPSHHPASASSTVSLGQKAMFAFQLAWTPSQLTPECLL